MRHSKNEKMNIMINFDEVQRENKQEDNLQWPKISEQSYRILIVGNATLGKTNTLLNIINYQPQIDKVICMSRIHMNSIINF